MTPLRQKFTKLWDTELTYEEIARHLGVNERTLYKIRIELNLPRRKRGPKKA
jgi:transposase-like protein